MAALLHDIGLYCLPDDLIDRDEATMSHERQLYESHPRHAAELLRELGGIDHVVIQAVFQHHERRDGSGYPIGLGPGQIGRVGEIVGIADEFIRLLVASKRDPKLRIFEQMKLRVFDGFSADVVNAFYAAVMPRELPRPRDA